MQPANAANDFVGVRLCLIGPLPPPSGGMANQTQQLATFLRREGATIEVIQSNTPYRPAWIGGIRVIRALFRLVPFVYRLWQVTKRVQLFHVMANSGWSWHLFTVPAVWVGVARRVPVVINYRGGAADIFLHRSFRWVEPTLRRATFVVVPSPFLHQVFRRRSFSTYIIPNAVDVERFFPRESNLQDRYPGQNKSAHIVVTRNLEKIYDIPTAIRAVRLVKHRLPNVRLTVAGSGPLRPELEALVAKLELDSTVIFTGRLDNEKIAALYGQADVMVNPSLVDNMPISILEAMASGVPVVTTNVGGIPYLVEDDKTGILVPPEDEHAMAHAIIRILTSEKWARRLSTAALSAVQEYTWPHVRTKWLRLYHCSLEK